MYKSLVPKVTEKAMRDEEYRFGQAYTCLEYLKPLLVSTRKWKSPERDPLLLAIDLAAKPVFHKGFQGTRMFLNFFEDNFPNEYRYLACSNYAEDWEFVAYHIQGANPDSLHDVLLVDEDRPEDKLSDWDGISTIQSRAAGICYLRADGAIETHKWLETFRTLSLNYPTSHLDFIIQFNLTGFKRSRTEGEDWAQMTLGDFLSQFIFKNNVFVVFDPELDRLQSCITLLEFQTSSPRTADPDNYIYPFTYWLEGYMKKFGKEEEEWARSNQERLARKAADALRSKPTVKKKKNGLSRPFHGFGKEE